MTDRKATSIRLSAEADRLLDELAAKLAERQGIKNRSAVLEIAIRELAKKWREEQDNGKQDEPHATR